MQEAAKVDKAARVQMSQLDPNDVVEELFASQLNEVHEEVRSCAIRISPGCWRRRVELDGLISRRCDRACFQFDPVIEFAQWGGSVGGFVPASRTHFLGQHSPRSTGPPHVDGIDAEQAQRRKAGRLLPHQVFLHCYVTTPSCVDNLCCS